MSLSPRSHRGSALIRSADTALVLLLTSACWTSQQAIEKMTPKDEDRLARDYLAMVARGSLDSATALLKPSIVNGDTRADLAKIQGLLQGAHIDSAHVIGTHTTSVAMASGARYRNTSLYYELPGASGWLEAEFLIADSGNVRVIGGFHVNAIARPLEETNAFTFTGRSAVYYLWYAAGIVNVLLSLTGVVLLVRAKGMPKKKRWIAASLIGVGKASLNWTTGAWSFAPLSIQLFGFATEQAGLASPTIVSFSVPLGAAFAIWEWYRWKHRKLDDTDPMPAPV